jgi:sn-glycerol 3-phosphate transport system ATP-binding protein
MLVMNAGRAEQIGAPIDVYTKPATIFVAGFIGSPPMNLIPGRIDPGGASLVTSDGGTPVRLPRPLADLAGREILLGVRPEHLELCEGSAALFAPHVDYVELLGSDLLAYGHVDGPRKGTRVAARLHASSTAHSGNLALRFDAANLHVFDPASGQRIEV